MFQPLFLDVIVGPMIAIVAGVYIILPALLIGLVAFLTAKLINKIKSRKEDET